MVLYVLFLVSPLLQQYRTLSNISTSALLAAANAVSHAAVPLHSSNFEWEDFDFMSGA